MYHRDENARLAQSVVTSLLRYTVIDTNDVLEVWLHVNNGDVEDALVKLPCCLQAAIPTTKNHNVLSGC